MINPENSSGEALFHEGYKYMASMIVTWTTIIVVAMAVSFFLFVDTEFIVWFSKILLVCLTAGTIGGTLWRYLDWKYNL